MSSEYRTNAAEAHALIPSLHRRMGREQLASVIEKDVQLCWRCVVAQPHLRVEPELVACEHGLKGGAGNLPVGNADEGSIERTDTGRAQPDVFHRTDEFSNFQRVPDVHGLVENQGGAGDDVLQCLLRRQGERDTANADPGERRRRVDAEMPQHHSDSHDDVGHVGDAADHPQQCRRGAEVAAGDAVEKKPFEFGIQDDQQRDDRDDRQCPRRPPCRTAGRAATRGGRAAATGPPSQTTATGPASAGRW